jgi:hypothetical protein
VPNVHGRHGRAGNVLRLYVQLDEQMLSRHPAQPLNLRPQPLIPRIALMMDAQV